MEAMSSSDAVYFSRVVMAEKMYMTAIPMRIITVGVTFLNIEKTTIIATGTNENRNALIRRPMSYPNPVNPEPKTMNMVTPNRAPDEIPVV